MQCRCGGAFPDSIPLLLAPVWGALGNLATDPAGPEVALERQLAAAQETVAAVQAAGKALDPDASLFHTVAALHVTSCTCLGPAHWFPPPPCPPAPLPARPKHHLQYPQHR